MGKRRWIPVIETELSATPSLAYTKILKLSRGVVADCCPAAAESQPIFSLFVSVEFLNGLYVNIPISQGMVDYFCNLVNWNGEIPDEGIKFPRNGNSECVVAFQGSADDFVLTIRPNREEPLRQRLFVRMSKDDWEKIIKFHEVVIFLQNMEKTRDMDRSRFDSLCKDIYNQIQSKELELIPTDHDFGLCDCEEVVPNEPCSKAAIYARNENDFKISKLEHIDQNRLKFNMKFIFGLVNDRLDYGLSFDGFQKDVEHPQDFFAIKTLLQGITDSKYKFTPAA